MLQLIQGEARVPESMFVYVLVSSGHQSGRIR